MNSGKENQQKYVIDKSSIINERKVKDGENLTLTKNKILSEKAEKSICEIIIDYGYGTGFFCKIKYLNKEI